MARDKTTQKGIGLIDNSVLASEDSSSQDTGVKRVVKASNTRPGLGASTSDQTRPGVGPDSSPARNKATYFQDAEASAPVSRRDIKERLATERGVGITPSKKLSTKPGVAPPSEPPPPPSEPPPPWDEITQEAPIVIEEIPAHAQVPSMESLRDEHTPVGSDVPAESESGASPMSDERSQFRTSPGGGKNRVSGGRAAAAAYISPSTLAPGQGVGKITAAVKVHEKVKEDARTFRTEPSLLRRRESSLPPPLPPGYGKRPMPWGWIGGATLFVAGSLLLLWLLRTPIAEPSKETRNAASARPMQAEMAATVPARPRAPIPSPSSVIAAPARSSSQAAPVVVKEERPPVKTERSPVKAEPSPPVAATPQLVAKPKVAPPAPQVATPPPAEKKPLSTSEDPWLD